MNEGEAYYIHIEFRHTVRTKLNEGKAILVMHFMKDFFYAVLPHNMADDIYTRPLATRMRYTVNWWAGWSVLLTRGLLPAC